MKPEIAQNITLFTGKSADYTGDTIDVSGHKHFAIQVNYSSTGNLYIQGSIDGSNWVDLEVDSSGNTSITLDGSSELINFVDVGFPYVRVKVTGSVTSVAAYLCIKR